MSLSSLSVGLSVLEAGSSGEGRRDSPRRETPRREEPQAVGVLVIMPAAEGVESPVHLHLAGLEQQDSGARSFESSMESETESSSRQLESVGLEPDGASSGSQSQVFEGEGEEENVTGSTVLRTSSPSAAATASSGGNGSASSSSSSSSSSLGQQELPAGEASNGTQPQAEVSNSSSSSVPSSQQRTQSASTTGKSTPILTLITIISTLEKLF